MPDAVAILAAIGSLLAAGALYRWHAYRRAIWDTKAELRRLEGPKANFASSRPTGFAHLRYPKMCRYCGSDGRIDRDHRCAKCGAPQLTETELHSA